VTIFGGNINENRASGKNFYASHHCEYSGDHLKTWISETPVAFPGLQNQIAADIDRRLLIKNRKNKSQHFRSGPAQKEYRTGQLEDEKGQREKQRICKLISRFYQAK
jgi:hypothetical protein